MVKDIKISIIMAVLNRANVIEQAISSVAEQTYENIELIVIDGGSTDGTVNIIKKYADSGKIAYWCSEPDNGIYDALNKGIAKATGDYVQILGSDDSLVDSQIIHYIAEQLLVLNDIDILSATVWTVEEESCIEYYYSNAFAKDKVAFCGGMIPHQGMFVRTQLMKRYRFDTSFRLSSDYDFFLKCYANPNIHFAYIDKPVAFYSHAGVSVRNRGEGIQEDKVINEKYHVIHGEAKAKIWINVKIYIKKVLIRMHLMTLMSKLGIVKGKKHHCNNKICRWCGRGV